MNFFRNLFKSKVQRKPQSVMLLEERSPACPVFAFVEQFEEVVFFFMQHVEDNEQDFPFRGVWVRNLAPAPAKFSKRNLRKGIPPLLEAKHCLHPQGNSSIDKEKLRIVWNESGDGAALLEGEDILAVIPSYSENLGTIGFARDCIGKATFCWALPAEVAEQVWEADAFWDSWEEEFDPLYLLKPRLEELYEEYFGPADAFFPVDEEEEWMVPEIYMRQGPQKLVLATIGMSTLAMPEISHYYEDYEKRHRIELGLMIDQSLTDKEVEDLRTVLGQLMEVPWQSITYLEEGAYIRTTALERFGFEELIVTSSLKAFPNVKFSDHRGHPIHVLWLVPLYSGELKLLKRKSLKLLISELKKLGPEVCSLHRSDISEYWFNKNRSGYSSRLKRGF